MAGGSDPTVARRVGSEPRRLEREPSNNGDGLDPQPRMPEDAEAASDADTDQLEK